jgi:hypothetical protein
MLKKEDIMSEQKTYRVVRGSSSRITFRDTEGKDLTILTGTPNIPELRRTIAEKLVEDPKLAEPGVKVEVTMLAKDDKGMEQVVTLVNETSKAAIEFLDGQTIPIGAAINMVQSLLAELSLQTDLKAALVIAVSGSQGLGGFGMLSTTSPVEDAHVRMLVQGARSQIELFTHDLKAKGFTFPEEGNLIVPGDSRFHQVPKA